MFEENSVLVRQQLFLFDEGVHKSIEDVPDLFNLREVVKNELDKRKMAGNKDSLSNLEGGVKDNGYE